MKPLTALPDLTIVHVLESFIDRIESGIVERTAANLQEACDVIAEQWAAACRDIGVEPCEMSPSVKRILKQQARN